LALPSTIHTFDIELSDVDRGVYETIALKVARHPSETEDYLITRVLAYCMELTEGLTFSRGLADPDEPALSVRDLTGTVLSWIEIGVPSADRLHKASKASPRVAVYTHKEPRQLLHQLSGARIHRAEELELYAFPRLLVEALTTRLGRRMAFALSVADQTLFLTIDGEAFEGGIARLTLESSA
jgi:uncharacterized protein YaeQ